MTVEPTMDPVLRAAAEAARGFMPVDEGLALYAAGVEAARVGPLLEIGSYCGKSTIYLAAAAHLNAWWNAHPHADDESPSPLLG
mgnify:CR=1 FL=1